MADSNSSSKVDALNDEALMYGSSNSTVEAGDTKIPSIGADIISGLTTNAVNESVDDVPESSDHCSLETTASNAIESREEEVEDIDISPDQDRGVVKQIIQPGTGLATPCYGERVHICYTGFYPVGNMLKPFTSDSEKCHFYLGKGLVVRGLDIGISTMTVNEQALFVIQPEYAYGSVGNPPAIPPGCVLFFKVELLDWKMEDLSPKRDDGILRKVIRKGEGPTFPNEGGTVKVEMIGYLQDKEFEHKEVEFTLGEGCNIDIPEGIEIALLKFKLHELSILYLKSSYAFGSDGRKELGVPKDADVVYEVTLLSFQKVKEVWEMNSDEKLEKSLEAKEKGIKYFKEGNIKVALKQFKRIVSCLENEPGVSLGSEKERKSLLVSGYLNVALCHKRLEQYIDAIKACDKALTADPKNEKALFRRGQCLMKINDCEEALEDFMNVLSINEDNQTCKKSIVECKAQIKKQKARDKKTYNNMFQKFLEQDEEERKRRQMHMETGTWDEKKKENSDNESK